MPITAHRQKAMRERCRCGSDCIRTGFWVLVLTRLLDANRYPLRSNRRSLLPQHRSTIWSSFRLSNQDRPRNATSITMPSPEEALFIDASDN